MQNIPLLFVQITSECNMDCAYCPFSHRNLKTKRDKEFALQIQTIEDVFLSSSFDNDSFRELIIYGGEALLYFEQIQKVVLKYKEFRKNGAITLCTNGFLFNEEIIKYCKENKIHVAINMDGGFELVKSIKSLSEPEWNDLLNTIKILKEEKFDFDFSTTITPQLIDNFEENIKFLESLTPRMIGFNFLRDKEAQEKFNVTGGEEYLKKALGLVYAHNSPLNFTRIKKLTAFKNGIQTPDCVCCGLGLTILSNGKYTTCGIFPSQETGSLNEVLKFIEENRIKLFRESKGERKFATYGGGCVKLTNEDNDIFSRLNASVSQNQFIYEKL